VLELPTVRDYSLWG